MNIPTFHLNFYHRINNFHYTQYKAFHFEVKNVWIELKKRKLEKPHIEENFYTKASGNNCIFTELFFGGKPEKFTKSKFVNMRAFEWVWRGKVCSEGEINKNAINSIT